MLVDEVGGNKDIKEDCKFSGLNHHNDAPDSSWRENSFRQEQAVGKNSSSISNIESL